MWSPFVKQVCALSGCISVYFLYGLLIGLQSIFLPILRGDGAEIILSSEQESWIPSSMILMQMPAQAVGGILADKLGRKIVVILSTVPGLIACILVYFAQNFYMLVIAYSCTGWLINGIVIGPVIVAESVSPKYRGAMLAIKNGFFTLGLTLTHTLGPICYWRYLALVGLIPSVIGLLSLIVTPESPAWLAQNGKFEDAIQSFKWYRGDNEHKELKQLIKSRKIAFQSQNTDKTKLNKLIEYLFERSFLKSLLISAVLFFYNEATGRRLFVTFSTDIGLGILPSAKYLTLLTILFDAIDISSTILAGSYMHRVGRLRLLITTGISSAILCLSFCLLNLLITLRILSESFRWVSTGFFLLNFLPLSLGVSPCLTALGGEVLPLSHRGVGTALLSLLYSGTMFIFTKYTFTMLRDIGVHGTYFVYTVICILCIIFIYLRVPETNLKTLIDVETEIRGDVECDEDVDELVIKLRGNGVEVMS